MRTFQDHSPHFYNLITRYVPKYQESVKWLEVNEIRIT
ncbi:MAG: M48 family metallopeptidase [Candidatus Nitrosopelagicus sp.]|nr:M48 family metallopeptidase [Candidatus Nitrosopelagicus sp.]